uniref:Uncharacterized protein n=1 Tax=Castor canadensis TaxID=51338 RepID=A0A8C0VYS8_CASCN
TWIYSLCQIAVFKKGKTRPQKRGFPLNPKCFLLTEKKKKSCVYQRAHHFPHYLMQSNSLSPKASFQTMISPFILVPKQSYLLVACKLTYNYSSGG